MSRRWHTASRTQALSGAEHTSVIPLGEAKQDEGKTITIPRNEISEESESGVYQLAACCVMRAGLRLLEEHEGKVEALRRALIEGDESGDAGPLDFDEIKREARRRAGFASDNA